MAPRRYSTAPIPTLLLVADRDHRIVTFVARMLHTGVAVKFHVV